MKTPREVWMCERCERLAIAPIPHYAVAEENRCPGEWVRGEWSSTVALAPIHAPEQRNPA